MFTSTLLQKSGIQVQEDYQIQSGSLGKRKIRVLAQIQQFDLESAAAFITPWHSRQASLIWVELDESSLSINETSLFCE
ncbi:hypothetical protein CDAR_32701 [Caerostris darwini]|uniref:Uncharacterized protein n=1 Tax=Caerostris darwini TaxID=1538125 RepID=A0AAV4PJ76_9ARAC|nr:hypothetical protein CDAR_32701 [Caerostris darwini]